MKHKKIGPEGRGTEPRSVVDYAAEFLTQAIISGELASGCQIKEEEIAGKLGISRPPLREALRALEKEGLVVRRPRKGVFVSEIKERDVWEIYTLKMALYALATRLAMERMTLRALRRLRKVVERMEACLRKSPPEVARYQAYHEEFHGLIIQLGGNERLERITSSLHNQVKRFSYRSLSHVEHLRRSFDYHKRILEAMERGDRKWAEELTREHVLEALDFLRKDLAGLHEGDTGGNKSQAGGHASLATRALVCARGEVGQEGRTG